MRYLLKDIKFYSRPMMNARHNNIGTFNYMLASLVDESGKELKTKYFTSCDGEIEHVKQMVENNKDVYYDDIHIVDVPLNNSYIRIAEIQIPDSKTGQMMWREHPQMIAKRILEARNRRGEVI